MNKVLKSIIEVSELIDWGWEDDWYADMRQGCVKIKNKKSRVTKKERK